MSPRFFGKRNRFLDLDDVDASFSSVDPFGLSIHFFPGAIGQSREKGLPIRILYVEANISYLSNAY